jgi:DNA invertase Pin-like site-specific DNA recombinase
MRQDQSTDQQLTELEAYCQKYNLIHRHRFVDEAKSGGSTAGRDDFNRMLDLYAQPDQRPRGLLLWNYARFARDIDDAQFNKIRIRQWGIAIHSLNDSIPEGEHGRIIEFLIDVANEEKRKQTSADARRGLKELVEKYGCVPGTPPLGFKRERVEIGLRRDKTLHIAHRWVPDPDLRTRIQTAFQMKAAGSTLLQIHTVTRLYKSINSYKTFFENLLYIGILKFGDLTIQSYCEPMIDQQTWDTVQRKLQASLQRRHLHSATHPRRQNGTYLLSGLIHCARCSSPLWGMTSRQRNGSYYYRYGCTRAKRNRDCDFQPIPARALERHVIDALQEFVKEPNNLAELMNADRQENETILTRSKIKISEKQKELAAVRRKISNTTAAISESGHSPALLKTLADLEAQETQLQTEILQLKNTTPQADPPLTPEEILVLSKSLSHVLQGKEPAEIRTGLLAITKNIVVDRRGNQVFGLLNFKKRTREPQDDEDSHAIITVPIFPTPLGAPQVTVIFEMAVTFFEL